MRSAMSLRQIGQRRRAWEHSPQSDTWRHGHGHGSSSVETGASKPTAHGCETMLLLLLLLLLPSAPASSEDSS
jgi:hypothetical protein